MGGSKTASWQIKIVVFESLGKRCINIERNCFVRSTSHSPLPFAGVIWWFFILFFIIYNVGFICADLTLSCHLSSSTMLAGESNELWGSRKLRHLSSSSEHLPLLHPLVTCTCQLAGSTITHHPGLTHVDSCWLMLTNSRRLILLAFLANDSRVTAPQLCTTFWFCCHTSLYSHNFWSLHTMREEKNPFRK